MQTYAKPYFLYMLACFCGMAFIRCPYIPLKTTFKNGGSSNIKTTILYTEEFERASFGSNTPEWIDSFFASSNNSREQFVSIDTVNKSFSLEVYPKETVDFYYEVPLEKYSAAFRQITIECGARERAFEIKEFFQAAGCFGRNCTVDLNDFCE